MKSNICKIEKGTQDLGAILKESEKVAVFNGLTHKQSLQLRLICEELDSMLPKLIDEFDGDFWIEFKDGVCKVHASIEFAEYSAEKKDALVSVAKNKKNAAAVGIVGKIRCAIENFFLEEDAAGVFEISTGSYYLSTGYFEGVDYTHLWTLDQYRQSVNKEEEAEAWDELEKSVLASVADDVIVGITGKRADIIIVKKFA